MELVTAFFREGALQSPEAEAERVQNLLLNIALPDVFSLVSAEPPSSLVRARVIFFAHGTIFIHRLCSKLMIFFTILPLGRCPVVSCSDLCFSTWRSVPCRIA